MKPFKIDLNAIIVTPRPNGYLARYVHPLTPRRLGLTHWLTEIASTPEEARERLTERLQGMGGVLAKEVV